MDKFGFRKSWKTWRPMSYQCFLLCCLLVLGLTRESKQLVIKNINVPPTVRAGESEFVILDCDYDLEDTPSKGLVVKWYFNTNELAYQWIYGRLPLAGETIMKYIDLTYKASDNPYTEYRAMKLNNPEVHLSGEYTCVISTFADERSSNASMIIYSTEEKFDLVARTKTIDNKDSVEITCLAEGLYPQPTLNVSIQNLPEKQSPKPSITVRKDGLYNILSRMTLLDEELPIPSTIKCSLSIPNANYNISQETIYYPGISTTSSTATTKLLGKVENQNENSQAGNGGGNSSDSLPNSVAFILVQLITVTLLYL